MASITGQLLKNDFIQREKYTLISIIIVLTFLIITPFIISSQAIAIQTLLNGLVLSSIYLMTSLGFSLIFGVAKQFKLSVGGYYVIGSYGMLFLINSLQIKPVFAFTQGPNQFFLSLLLILPLLLTVVISVKVMFFLFGSKAGNLASQTVQEKTISINDRFRGFISDQSKINIYSIVLGLAPIISLLSMFFISGKFSYAFFSGLAISCITISAIYLEFDKKAITLIVMVFSIINPILFLTYDFKVIFINLAIIATIFTAILAMLSDRYLLNKIRQSSVNVMIVTFALAIFIQSFIQLMFFPSNGESFTQFGVVTHNLDTIIPKSETIEIFGGVITTVRIFALSVFTILMILFFVFMNYSRIGLAIKAVSQDEVASELAGINIRKITAIVSGIGMGLIALASILTSPFAANPLWNPSMGWTVLIFAIIVVTLGGMGSLLGTVFAALILGMTTVLVSFLNFTFSLTLPFVGDVFSITIDSSYSSILPLIIVILVMIVKPNGLFGKKEQYK